MAQIAQKISPFLWFDDRAEEAARFYTSIFERSEIGTISRYSDAGPGPAGSVMTVSFRLDGLEFMALNGGPRFSFTPAVSFMVSCENQAEVDRFWERLGEGGTYVQCGWLTDKFGLSWQIVPQGIGDYLAGDDADGAERAMNAMFAMQKLDIDVLRAAYEGVSAG